MLRIWIIRARSPSLDEREKLSSTCGITRASQRREVGNIGTATVAAAAAAAAAVVPVDSPTLRMHREVDSAVDMEIDTEADDGCLGLTGFDLLHLC